MRLQIAIRNVFRNRRRTLLNIIMIVGGISAIVVFRGFAHHTVFSLQEIAINSQFGHLQIANNKLWDLSIQDTPRDRLLQLSPAVLERVRALPEVSYTSGRLSFFGLISSGDHSLSARGSGFDPGVEAQMLAATKIVKGKTFEPNSTFEVLLGSGLQKEIGVEVGSSVSLLAYTFDGSVNAIDADVVGIFQTGLAEVDNTTFFVPLKAAQRLLDTDLVERTIVQLKQTSDTDAVRSQIASILPADLKVKSWGELATLYVQVVEYYNIQNLLIEWILMLLVLLSIANTVGMAVSERTGEIGTVRALGDTGRDLIVQFLTEGLVLGLLGGVIGCLVGFGLSQIVTALKIPLVLPGASVPMLVVVDFIPKAYFEAVLLTCVASVLASLVPAYRASKIKIVEALRHNT